MPTELVEGKIIFLAIAQDPLACMIANNQVVGLHKTMGTRAFQLPICNLLLQFYQGFKGTNIIPSQLKTTLEEAKPISTDQSILQSIVGESYKPSYNEGSNHGMYWEMHIYRTKNLSVYFDNIQIEFGEPLDYSVKMKPKEAFLILGNIFVNQSQYLCERIYSSIDNPLYNKNRAIKVLKVIHEKDYKYNPNIGENTLPYHYYLVEYIEYIRQQIKKRYITPLEILSTGGVNLLLMSRDLEEVQKFLFDIYCIMKDKNRRMKISQSLETAYYVLLNLLAYETQFQITPFGEIHDKIFLRDDFRIDWGKLSKITGWEVFMEVRKKFPPNAERWYKYSEEYFH